MRVHETVRAQVEKRPRFVAVHDDQAKRRRAVDAEGGERLGQIGHGDRETEHEQRRQRCGCLGPGLVAASRERAEGRDPLVAVQRGIRLVSPQVGEGRHREPGSVEVGSEVVHELRSHSSQCGTARRRA